MAKFEIKDGVAVIPEGTTKIGFRAFDNCTSLTHITIPKSVNEIVSAAFRGCTNLTGITIPESVTKIGSRAFMDCTALTSITIPDGVTEIGEGVFMNCNSLTDITIPKGITEIPWAAFQNCTALTSIVIPEGVTEISGARSFMFLKSGAFEGCTNLARITIPESMTKIDQKTFKGCNSLTSIVIPKSVTEIGESAFEDCTSLTDIVLPEGVTEIKNRTFYGCSSLINIVISEGVTRIYQEAFANCTTLSRIFIPKSVRRIDDGSTFAGTNLINIAVDKGNPEYDSREGCNAIIYTKSNRLVVGCRTTIIPDSIEEIGYSAFSNSIIDHIEIPKSVNEIHDYAFQHCKNLTQIVISKTVERIGYGVFVGAGLTKIVVEEGNPEYDSREGCNAIIETATNNLIAGCKTTIIPDSIEVIGYIAFRSSTIDHINIPQSVEIIEDDAFRDCRNLIQATVPKSVKKMGYHVFANCSKLENLSILGPIEELLELFLPEDKIYNTLKSITFGDISITAFTERAKECIQMCENLQTLYAPADKLEDYRSMFSKIKDYREYKQ